MKTILVTGGAGFIGSHLIDRLLKEGQWKVLCIDNFDPFYNPQIKFNNIRQHLSHPNFKLHRIDISHGHLLHTHLARESVDVIVHIAAKAGVRPSIQNPMAYTQVNVNGTLNILELAKIKGVKQVVFASSSSVYGVNPNVPWSEDNLALDPISPYAATKLSAELLGRTYSNLYGIRFVALRFFTVYGPRQRPDLAIHKFTKAILHDEPITMYGDGTTRRDYTFVEDIIQGVCAAMDYDQTLFEIINLGNSQTISLKRLITVLEKVLDKRAVIHQLPEQAGDVPQTFANIEKAKRLLAYQPQTDLRSGLAQFRNWYLKNAQLLQEV